MTRAIRFKHIKQKLLGKPVHECENDGLLLHTNIVGDGTVKSEVPTVVMEDLSFKLRSHAVWYIHLQVPSRKCKPSVKSWYRYGEREVWVNGSEQTVVAGAAAPRYLYP
jgi:hypothetical protein